MKDLGCPSLTSSESEFISPYYESSIIIIFDNASGTSLCKFVKVLQIPKSQKPLKVISLKYYGRLQDRFYVIHIL